MGVNHAHQYPGNPHGSSENFTSFLESESRRYDIDLLAEEMSLEALRRQHLKISSVQMVATRLEIRHVLCDPDQLERERLGIPSTEEIKAELAIGACMTDTQISILDKKERSFWPKREEEWLRRANTINHRTCLFVIGSAHIPTFFSLLNQSNYQTTVLCERWNG